MSRTFVMSVVVLVAALALATGSGAGFESGRSVSLETATPLYWTSGHAEQALKQQATLIMSVVAYGNHSLVQAGLASADPREFAGRGGPATAATCQGFGTRHKLGFASFQCQVQWSNRSDVSHTVYQAHIWMRPLPWTASSRWGAARMLICASTRTLADCPPPLPARPLANDPRMCPADCSPEASVGNLALKAENVALIELRARLGVSGVFNLGCQAASVFVYRCTWAGRTPSTATVSFVRGKTAWTTTVTLG
jgi:hypothetical protein